MKKFKILAVLISSVLLLSACSPPSESLSKNYFPENAIENVPERISPSQYDVIITEQVTDITASVNTLLISYRNGNQDIYLKDLEALDGIVMNAIQKLAGMVPPENRTEKNEEMLEALRELSTKITEVQFSFEEITEESDIKSLMQNGVDTISTYASYVYQAKA